MRFYFSYSKCDNFIQDFKEGKLQTQPGCSADDTLEVSVQQTENICIVVDIIARLQALRL